MLTYDDERVDIGRDEGGWCQRSNRLSQGDGEDLSDEYNQELISGARAIGVQARDIVKRKEEENGAKHTVWHLRKNHRQREWECLVCLGHLLTERDHTLDSVLGFNLSENEGWQNRDLEDNEHAVLQRCSGVVQLKVHETCEQSDDDVVEEASEAVVGSAPERQVLASDNLLNLVRHRCSELLLLDWLGRTNSSHALFLDLTNVALDLSEFLRISPYISPIAVTNARSGTSTDGIEHPLGRVGIRRAVSTVAMEVVKENMGVFADVTEVNTLATPLEKEQSVEVFEKSRVGLMDSAQDGLASGSKFAKETNDVESTLRIETRSRLVQEQEELRLGSEFDTYGNTLALFDG